MERYYDLIMAGTMKKYARDTGMDLPGVAEKGASERERWETMKTVFYESAYGVISEWGLIDFDPAEKKTLVGGDKLSYDEYLLVQKRSYGHVRTDFEKAYHDTAYVSFKGQIEKVNGKSSKVCFKRIFIYGEYSDGDGFFGKEDHVWMDLTGFEEYRIGDCLSFVAEIYRYLKTGSGKMIDFGLRNPEYIRQIESYDLPSDEQLRLQAVDEIICNDLCMFRDHCYASCIANQEWREGMRKMLLGK